MDCLSQVTFQVKLSEVLSFFFIDKQLFVKQSVLWEQLLIFMYIRACYFIVTLFYHHTVTVSIVKLLDKSKEKEVSPSSLIRTPARNQCARTSIHLVRIDTNSLSVRLTQSH